MVRQKRSAAVAVDPRNAAGRSLIGGRLRSAEEFDSYYQSPDPWKIGQASRRDRVLARTIGPYVAGKAILELGCGEGHLTATVFKSANCIKGIDISSVAVSRAITLSLPNASFQAADFLNISFAGYDVIAAIECLYYLSPTEQETFFRKLASEHAGKVFVVSAPIIGSNEHRTYFTDGGIRQTFARHGLSLVECRNLNAYRKAGVGATIAAGLCRLPVGTAILDILPDRYVYQRCYVARCATP
jgi:predicted TPR repeat methyltransferase